MIDLHAHILPGFDDGPRTREEALQMCRRAAEDGIKVILATPHALNGHSLVSTAQVYQAVTSLNTLLAEGEIDVIILPGADVHLDSCLIEKVREGQVLTVNNNRRYILLEFPATTVPASSEQILFQLMLQGVVPIITHPERNYVFQKEISCLERFVQQGALVQVTAMSLTGQFGREPQKSVVKMLKKGLVHVIASDAHSVAHRPPLLSRAVHSASEIVGEEKAKDMVSLVPELIVKGEKIDD